MSQRNEAAAAVEIEAIARALCKARHQDPDRIITDSLAVVSSGGSITRENAEEVGSRIIASTPYQTRQQPIRYPRWRQYEHEANSLHTAGIRAKAGAA